MLIAFLTLSSTAAPAAPGVRVAAAAQPAASSVPRRAKMRQAKMPTGRRITLKPGGSGHPYGGPSTSPDLTPELNGNKLRRAYTDGSSHEARSHESGLAYQRRAHRRLWETSGAADGNTVFLTGNWNADFSSDGTNFTQMNPLYP